VSEGNTSFTGLVATVRGSARPRRFERHRGRAG